MTELKKYKAFFRRCELDDRKNFRHSRCFMPISVGQPLHEGAKFIATLDLINRSFKECVLLIDDSVQRHTMAIDNTLTPAELYQEAMRVGDEWLERNKPIYGRLTIPCRIIRWDKWLEHPHYAEKKLLIESTYEEDASYKLAFTHTIEEFLNRYQKNNAALTEEEYQRAYSLCVDYIKEECAALCLWIEEACQFEVYPSGRNLAMIATYEKFIKPSHPDLLISASLYFKSQIIKDNKMDSVAMVEELLT